MFFRKRKSSEDSVRIPRAKYDEPWIAFTEKEKILKIQRQIFLDEARKVFTEDQVAFMEKHIANRIY